MDFQRTLNFRIEDLHMINDFHRVKSCGIKDLYRIKDFESIISSKEKELTIYINNTASQQTSIFTLDNYDTSMVVNPTCFIHLWDSHDYF